MTELHTPVVAGSGLVAPVAFPRPLHRDHGGLGQNLPIGLEEGPPVVAGGNGALTGTSGEGVV